MVTGVPRLFNPNAKQVDLDDLFEGTSHLFKLPAAIHLYRQMLHLDSRDRQLCILRTGNERNFMVAFLNILGFVKLYSEATGYPSHQILSETVASDPEFRFVLHTAYSKSKKDLFALLLDRINLDGIFVVTMPSVGIHVLASVEPQRIYPFRSLIDMVFPDDPACGHDFSQIKLEEIEPVFQGLL